MYEYFIVYDAISNYNNIKGNCSVNIDHRITMKDIKGIEKQLKDRFNYVQVIISNFILL